MPQVAIYSLSPSTACSSKMIRCQRLGRHNTDTCISLNKWLTDKRRYARDFSCGGRRGGVPAAIDQFRWQWSDRPGCNTATIELAVSATTQYAELQAAMRLLRPAFIHQQHGPRGCIDWQDQSGNSTVRLVYAIVVTASDESWHASSRDEAEVGCQFVEETRSWLFFSPACWSPLRPSCIKQLIHTRSQPYVL